jgi:hypothetical protein
MCHRHLADEIWDARKRVPPFEEATWKSPLPVRMLFSRGVNINRITLTGSGGCQAATVTGAVQQARKPAGRTGMDADFAEIFCLHGAVNCGKRHFR